MYYVLTVGHKRFDSRIWVKEITTLVNSGYSICYLVADGEGNQFVNGVEIRDFGEIPQRSGFWRRMRSMYRIVRASGLKRGDIIHFHDGVFLPLVFLLWMQGCKVIYDVHEDYPRQVLNTRFHAAIKKSLSLTFSFLEWLAGKLFSGIIAATPKIAERFPTDKTVVVQNYPIISELLVSRLTSYTERPPKFVYIGGINCVRGIREMVTALTYIRHNQSITLELAGNFSPPTLEEEIRKMPGWQHVKYRGWLSRTEVANSLNNARAGLVLLHPVRNYVESQPIKMYEYMSAGIPVIASDFPIWRKIIEDIGCGLLVDPMNPNAIANAMSWILQHPDKAAEMGRRGKEAVELKYNWDIEVKKLIDFVKTI